MMRKLKDAILSEMAEQHSLVLGITVVLVALGIVLLLNMCAAHAHLRGEPQYDAWFERQHNRSGMRCCDPSEAVRLAGDDIRAYTGPQQYADPNNLDYIRCEVRINGDWYEVRTRDYVKLTANDPNPTGSALVWYVNNPMSGVIVHCFYPGTMT